MKIRVNMWLWVGISLVILSLAGELLPSTNQGIGPLQVYVIGLGCFIIVVSQLTFLNRLAFRSVLFIRGLYLISVTILGLLGIEGGLYVLGYTPIYSTNPTPVYGTGLACDAEYGCLWHWECVLSEELCPGYRYIGERWYNFVSDNWFTWYHSSLNIDKTHILVTGDSFTAGASATNGNSWVELLYTHLDSTAPQNVAMWNTAIAGTATDQALATTRYFAEISEVDMVLLGFFTGNDYFENLFPLDSRVTILDERHVPQLVMRYNLGDDFELKRLDAEQLYYRSRGLEHIPEDLQSYLFLTRIGSIIGQRLYGQEANRLPDNYFAQATLETRKQLQELQNVVSAHNIPLVILLIPSREALVEQDIQYLTALRLFDELDIAYIDPLEMLTELDYATSPDIHWSNAGHKKAAELVISCIEMIMNTGGEMCPQALH